MKILFIGDIVASPGRKVVEKVLPILKRSDSISLTVANAENLAHGRGATEATLRDMMSAGVDYFTGGDHLLWGKGIEDVIETLPIIRPANYPEGTAGVGYKVIELGNKGRVLLVNLLGRTFLNERLDDPFKTADKILEMRKDENLDAILVDFHAEATSEKMAMGFYLDGRVTAILGTHTHVPTADAMTLPNGTLFISDVGMTGNIDSVLGVKKEIVIKQYTSAINQKFEWEEEGRTAFRSVMIDTEKKELTRIDKYS
ncbi:YmdB family metallophosphoesterase [candidate division WWE3 bacterium]|nr:YmdB family metallophosphoesterase [candidate division WWE3 bacterium]